MRLAARSASATGWRPSWQPVDVAQLAAAVAGQQRHADIGLAFGAFRHVADHLHGAGGLLLPVGSTAKVGLPELAAPVTGGAVATAGGVGATGVSAEAAGAAASNVKVSRNFVNAVF